MLTGPLREDRPEILDQEGLSDRGLRILADLERWNRLSGWTAGHMRRIEKHWEALGRPEPFRVLDVGTGPGALLEAIAEHFESRGVATELVGVDLSPTFAEKARSRLGDRATVVEADATALPFEDKAFHLGTTALMIHHLPKPLRPQVIAELARTCDAAYVFDLEVTWTGAVGWAAVAGLLGMHADTRHDGVLSVRRACTLDEFRALCAPLKQEVRRVFPTAMVTGVRSQRH
jgi:SAM-dependent methyltransferase